MTYPTFSNRPYQVLTAVGLGFLTAGVSLLPAQAEGDSAKLSTLIQIRQASESGSFKQAQTLAQDLVRRYPQDAEAHLAAAEVFRNMGLISKAVAEYEISHKLNAARPEPLIALCELSLQDLQFEKSLQYGQDAVRVAPGSQAAKVALINALVKNDRLLQAQERIAPLLRESPLDPNLLFLSYQIARKRGYFVEAKESLERSLKRSHQKLPLLLELADLLDAMGEHTQARVRLKEALALRPTSLEANLKLATNLEYYFADYNGAIEQYQRILALDPDSVTAAAGIHRCQKKKNDLAGQMKLFIRSWFLRGVH